MALTGPVEIWYLSIFYLSIVTGFKFPIRSVFMLTLALILYEANIVLINDIFDRKVDIAAGKSGRVRGHNLSIGTMVLLFLLTGAVSWGFVFVINGTWVFYLVWGIAYVTGFFYSAPPLRLKSKGIPSLVCNSVLERPYPILLAFLFFRYYGIELLIFPILSEFVWSVFKHQVHDVETDASSGVRTFAVTLGREKSYKIVKYLINPVGVLAVLIFATFSTLRVPKYSQLFMLSIVLIVAGTLFSIYLERKSIVYTDPLDPPYSMFVNFVFPFAVILPLGLIMALDSPTYIPLLVLFVLPLIRDLTVYKPALSRAAKLSLIKSKRASA